MRRDQDAQYEHWGHLNPDEKLYWTGRPKTVIIFRSADIFMIPFSVIWCGFAIFWFTAALVSEAPFFFSAFGIPFVIIGLYFVFGRFWADSIRRANTTYGITDNRIILKYGTFSKKIESLNIRTLSDITIDEKGDGSGTITLGPTHPFYSMYQGMNWPGMKNAPALELIPDVRKIYDLIIKLQKEK